MLPPLEQRAEVAAAAGDPLSAQLFRHSGASDEVVYKVGAGEGMAVCRSGFAWMCRLCGQAASRLGWRLVGLPPTPPPVRLLMLPPPSGSGMIGEKQIAPFSCLCIPAAATCSTTQVIELIEGRLTPESRRELYLLLRLLGSRLGSLLLLGRASFRCGLACLPD
jgi:hypothetical protein